MFIEAQSSARSGAFADLSFDEDFDDIDLEMPLNDHRHWFVHHSLVDHGQHFPCQASRYHTAGVPFIKAANLLPDFILRYHLGGDDRAT